MNGSHERSSDMLETVTQISLSSPWLNMVEVETLTRRSPVLLNRWVLDSGIASVP